MERWLRAGLALLMAPVAWIAAAWRGVPGLAVRRRISVAVAELMLRRKLGLQTGLAWLVCPMDSTRYFEYEQVWASATRRPFRRHLDVSSPRLLPLMLLRACPDARSEFLNPDVADLAETRSLATALGLAPRASFRGNLLDDAPYEAASFDLITCISVLEHIPDDDGAVRRMWALLEPGGTLVLTLPCMSMPLEQYISQNVYGVLPPGDDGYTYWQRYYDAERLAGRIFAVTGAPSRVALHGERERGLFMRNATAKRLLGSRYPFWREPWMMATEWRPFERIEDLPGDGVILLEFVKP